MSLPPRHQTPDSPVRCIARCPTNSSKLLQTTHPFMSITLKCWDEPDQKCPSKNCYNDHKDETYYSVYPTSNISILITKIPANSSGTLHISEFYLENNTFEIHPLMPLYPGQYLNLPTPIWNDTKVTYEPIFRIHLDPSPNLPTFQSTNIIIASNDWFECKPRDPMGIEKFFIVAMIFVVVVVLACCFGCCWLWRVGKRRREKRRMYLVM